jgi:hypothetical protein
MLRSASMSTSLPLPGPPTMPGWTAKHSPPWEHAVPPQGWALIPELPGRARRLSSLFAALCAGLSSQRVCLLSSLLS